MNVFIYRIDILYIMYKEKYFILCHGHILNGNKYLSGLPKCSYMLHAVGVLSLKHLFQLTELIWWCVCVLHCQALFLSLGQFKWVYLSAWLIGPHPFLSK